MKNMPMDNNAEIETVLTRSREARENNATAGQLNFGAATFKEGIKRIANNHHDFATSRLRVNPDRDEKTK